MRYFTPHLLPRGSAPFYPFWSFLWSDAISEEISISSEIDRYRRYLSPISTGRETFYSKDKDVNKNPACLSQDLTQSRRIQTTNLQSHAFK